MERLQCVARMWGLYPCHEKQTKNPVWWTTGSRFGIEILMSRMRKLKGSAAGSLRLKILNDNPYLTFNIFKELLCFFTGH